MTREPTKEELAQALRDYPTWGHAMVAAQDSNIELREALDELMGMLKGSQMHALVRGLRRKYPRALSKQEAGRE